MKEQMINLNDRYVIPVDVTDNEISNAVLEVEQIMELSDFKPVVFCMALGNALPTPDIRFEWLNVAGVNRWNYTQTFRNNYAIPESKELSKVAGLYRADEFVRNLELHFLFGKRGSDDSGQFCDIYYMDGIYGMINTNVKVVDGCFGENTWESFIENQAFASGSNEKIMVCGDLYFEHFKVWSLGKPDIFYLLDRGINTLSIVTESGKTLHVFRHSLAWDNEFTKGIGIVIDPADIGCRYLELPHTYPDSLCKNGKPQHSTFRRYTWGEWVGYSGEYFADIGLELHSEQNHAIIKVEL